MSESNLPPFAIGQRVVCVRDDFAKDGLIKDAIYLVKDVTSCGKCKRQFVNVGIPTKTNRTSDECCGISVGADYKLFYYFDSRCFAPITSNFQHIQYKEVLEKEKVLIGVN